MGIENTSSQAPPPSAITDWFLQLLVSMTNDAMFEIGITLQVSGMLVSVISRVARRISRVLLRSLRASLQIRRWRLRSNKIFLPTATYTTHPKRVSPIGYRHSMFTSRMRISSTPPEDLYPETGGCGGAVEFARSADSRSGGCLLPNPAESLRAGKVRNERRYCRTRQDAAVRCAVAFYIERSQQNARRSATLTR